MKTYFRDSLDDFQQAPLMLNAFDHHKYYSLPDQSFLPLPTAINGSVDFIVIVVSGERVIGYIDCMGRHDQKDTSHRWTLFIHYFLIIKAYRRNTAPGSGGWGAYFWEYIRAAAARTGYHRVVHMSLKGRGVPDFWRAQNFIQKADGEIGTATTDRAHMYDHKLVLNKRK